MGANANDRGMPTPRIFSARDSDGIPDSMVKSDRAAVISYILANVDIEGRFVPLTLTITGYLNDGTPFQGSDTIRIINPINHWKIIYLEKLGIVTE